MRARPVVLIGFVALAAAATVLLLRVRARPRSAAPLLAVAPAAVTRISAAAAGQPKLVLVRRGRRWMLTSPVQAPADASRVADLLADLGEPVSAAYPATSVSASAAGLAPPAAVVTANRGRLEFGALNPASLLRYVRRGDEVVLTMDRIAPLLQLGPWQFVERRLVPPGTALRSLRLPDGRGAPPRLLRAWQAARARRIVPLGGNGLRGRPRYAATFAGASATAAFAVLARRPQLELARPDLGIVYVFPRRAAALLLGARIPPPPGSRDDAGAARGRNHAPRTRAAPARTPD